MRSRMGDLAGCLLLAALVLGCFARLAAAPGALIVDGERPSIDYTQREDPRPVGNDVTFSFLPRFLELSRSVAAIGRPPLWDAPGFGGRPLIGNPQGGLFYPPVWLAWMTRSPAALGWLTLGHLLWGGIGAYVLGRSQGLGRWSALVAAGCFEAAPYVLAQTVEGHYPHVWAASWYPWAFCAYGQHRLGRVWASLVLPLILALTFLTGHPQEWFYLIFALSLWAAADAWQRLRTDRWPGAARGLVLWGGLVGLSLALVAAELIPDLAAQEWSLRAARMTLRQASKYHVHAINLFQLLGPGALGGPAEFFGDDNYWETVLSIGLVPLVLTLIAVRHSPDRARMRAWGALALLAVLFAGGHRLGVFPASFRLVPGMDRFRVPARSLFLANLGAAMLCGFGVEALLGPSAPADLWRSLARDYRRLAAVLVAGLLLAYLANRPTDPQAVPARPALWEIQYGHPRSPLEDRPGQRIGRAAARLLQSGPFWLALTGTGALLFLGGSTLRSLSGRRVLAARLLGALALVELATHGHALVRVAPAGRFLAADPISQVLRTAAPAGNGPLRIRARDSVYPDIHAFANGIEKVNVNDGFQLQHAADLYQTLYPLLFRSTPCDPAEPMGEAVAEYRRAVRQAVLDRLNVAFLVSDHIEPELAWPLVATGVWNGQDFAIHRNPTAMPRAYVVPRAEVAGDDTATVLSRFCQVDPRCAVLMARDPLGPAGTGPRQPFTPASWRSHDPDRLVLDVATEAPGLLVVADTWMPGWTALVDDRPAPILRGNHAQRVIPLPEPGRHRVVLHYAAPGLARGMTISAAALAVWLAAALLLLVRRTSVTAPVAAGDAPRPGSLARPIRAACGATIPASAAS